MKKTGFNGYFYDFSVDYNATDVDDIKGIHKYLMKKNNMIYNIYTCLKNNSYKVTYKNVFIYLKKYFI